MRRSLGFSPAAGLVVPPVDPFTLAFNIGATLAPALVNALRGREHLDANRITPEQNRLHYEVLAPAVEAKDNPATPVEDLFYWADELRRRGEEFYQFAAAQTQYGTEAAAGAIRTMFGKTDAGGNWFTTSDAPGYATQILADLERIISERTGMQSQLGIDWGKLIQTGVQVAANITGGPVSVSTPRGSVVALPPTQTAGRYYNPYPAVVGAVESVPGWVWGAGAVAIAAGVLWAASSGGGRRR